MEIVGYKNADRVYALAARGKLNKIRKDGKPSLDDSALNILMFMALHCINKEDAQAVKKEGRPYWCYWGGQNQIIEGLGLGPNIDVSVGVDGNVSPEAIKQLEVRVKAAKNKITSACNSLRSYGLLKELKAPNSFAGKNKLWLLLLGNQSENEEAERQARAYFGLPFSGEKKD